MSNQLAVYQNFDGIQRAAVALHKSGYFTDVKSEAQAIVKVLAGAELGLPPFASMSGIHIVQGKPVLGANVIATLVKNSGRYDYNVKTCTAETCAIEWLENGQKRGESTFTMSEAQAAGLTGKDNWKKYPSDMLFARAISRGARRFAPGIFGGAPVYTPDEMNVEMNEDGFIEGEAQPAPETEPTPEPRERLTAEQASADLFGTPEPQKNGNEPQEAPVASDGTPYEEMETKDLSHRANALMKSLKSEPLSKEARAEKRAKLDEIQRIIKSRQ